MAGRWGGTPQPCGLGAQQGRPVDGTKRWPGRQENTTPSGVKSSFLAFKLLPGPSLCPPRALAAAASVMVDPQPSPQAAAKHRLFPSTFSHRLGEVCSCPQFAAVVFAMSQGVMGSMTPPSSGWMGLGGLGRVCLRGGWHEAEAGWGTDCGSDGTWGSLRNKKEPLLLFGVGRLGMFWRVFPQDNVYDLKKRKSII